MKINWHIPYLGIEHHEEAIKMLGATRFLGEFCICGSYAPVAMYYSKNPDTSKGHKQFPYLTMRHNILFVGALDKKEFEKFRYQQAAHCKKCDEVIYSKYRHDFHYCSCDSVSIDGGRDYLKILHEDDAIYEIVDIDFFTGKIKKKG